MDNMNGDIKEFAASIPDSHPEKELLLLAELLRQSQELHHRTEAMAVDVDAALTQNAEDEADTEEQK